MRPRRGAHAQPAACTWRHPGALQWVGNCACSSAPLHTMIVIVELLGRCNPALLRADSLLGAVPPISLAGRVPGVTGRAQVLAARPAVSRCPGGRDILAVRRHAPHGGARRGGPGASHRGRRLQQQALVPNCGRLVLPAPPGQPCCTLQHSPRHCHAYCPNEQLLTHLEQA